MSTPPLSPRTAAPPLETSLVNTKANDQYVLGLKAKRNHNNTQAYIHFSKAIFLLPTEPILYAARAESCIQLCDLTSAVSNYKKALSLQAQPDPAHRQRLAALLDCTSVLCFISSRFDRALIQANTALQYSPQNKPIRLHRALALFMLRRQEEALRDATCCEGTEQCQPYAWAAKGVFLLMERNFARAKCEVEKCLLVAPDLPLVNSLEMLYDAMLGRLKDASVADMEAGRWGEAITKLTTVLEAFPNDGNLYVLRSKCYVAREEFTKGVEDLFESMNRSGVAEGSGKMLADCLVRIAGEMFGTGGFHQALSYADEALRWDANCLSATIVRGECFRMLGSHESSVEEFLKVLAIDPTHQEGMRRLAVSHCSYGVILYNQGHYGKAENEFSRALSYCYDNPVYHLNRARCLLMIQQPSAAVQELVICKKLNPTDPKIQATLKQMCPPDVYQALEVHLKRGEHHDPSAIRQLGNSGIYIAPSPPDANGTAGVAAARHKRSEGVVCDTYTNKARLQDQHSVNMFAASSWPGMPSVSGASEGNHIKPQQLKTPLNVARTANRMIESNGSAPERISTRRDTYSSEIVQLRSERKRVLTDPYSVTAVRGFVAQQSGPNPCMGRLQPNGAALWKGASSKKRTV